MADSPYYRFFRRFSVPLPIKRWERLPRFASYKNEYWDGAGRYTPRPQTCALHLDLANWRGPADEPADDEEEPPPARRDRVVIRRLREADWAEMPRAFHAAFCRQLPLSMWGERGGARAARCIVEWTRRGRDGPLVRDACFTAWSHELAKPDGPPDLLCGSAVVTFVPAGGFYRLPAGAAVPDPADPSRRVVPHLDWIFVNVWLHRRGIATALLGSVVRSLRAAGYTYLSSACLVDNFASIQWHWRNGFQLTPSGWSRASLTRFDHADGGEAGVAGPAGGPGATHD